MGKILGGLIAGVKGKIDQEKCMEFVASRIEHYKLHIWAKKACREDCKAIKLELQRTFVEGRFMINGCVLTATVESHPDDFSLRKAGAKLWKVVEASNVMKGRFRQQYVKIGPQRGVELWCREALSLISKLIIKYYDSNHTFEVKDEFTAMIPLLPKGAQKICAMSDARRHLLYTPTGGEARQGYRW